MNISGHCREAVLATDVTAYDIFDGARSEVLDVMEASSVRPNRIRSGCDWLCGGGERGKDVPNPC